MAVVLSPEQQRVVAHREGHLQVIACAGSGKTESISRRIAALIESGAEPASIVAFTFTERAASELKERVVERVRDVGCSRASRSGSASSELGRSTGNRFATSCATPT